VDSPRVSLNPALVPWQGVSDVEGGQLVEGIRPDTKGVLLRIFGEVGDQSPATPPRTLPQQDRLSPWVSLNCRPRSRTPSTLR
jgi:hypothetical protein